MKRFNFDSNGLCLPDVEVLKDMVEIALRKRKASDGLAKELLGVIHALEKAVTEFEIYYNTYYEVWLRNRHLLDRKHNEKGE